MKFLFFVLYHSLEFLAYLVAILLMTALAVKGALLLSRTGRVMARHYRRRFA